VFGDGEEIKQLKTKTITLLLEKCDGIFRVSRNIGQVPQWKKNSLVLIRI
jgi:hypothetical protein